MAIVAFLNGKTAGFGAPPAREMRDGGDFCINSATAKGKYLDYNLIIAAVAHTLYRIIAQVSLFCFTTTTGSYIWLQLLNKGVSISVALAAEAMCK